MKIIRSQRLQVSGDFRKVYIIFPRFALFYLSLRALSRLDLENQQPNPIHIPLHLNMSNSNLGDLPVLPLAESFALTAAYNADSFSDKVNLGQGVYRNEACQPWVLPSVRAVSFQVYH